MKRRPSRGAITRQQRVYNGRFFAGALPELPVHWCRMGCYAQYRMPSPAYPDGRILLSNTEDAPCGWRGILLHEMVHAYLWHTAKDRSTGGTVSEDHGHEFAAECNRIGREMGLPEVSDSDSWAWPWHHLDSSDLHDAHD
jgi:hypothetical protein